MLVAPRGIAVGQGPSDIFPMGPLVRAEVDYGFGCCTLYVCIAHVVANGPMFVALLNY